MGKNKLRLLVIGLDGATFYLIKPLSDQGKLPNLSALMQTGSSGSLRSTLPPVTAPAWTSFMTGKNPAKHGIFQWRTYDLTKYSGVNEKIVTTKSFAGTTFWDYLGNKGLKTAVITVPVTYPVWPINGIMVSGYPCPDTKLNFTYPEAYGNKLTESYNFQVDYYTKASPDEIYQNGLAMLRKRTDLALSTILEESVDCCVLVLGEIDRAQHDFWKYTEARFPSYHNPALIRFRQAIEDHYGTSDEQVGRLLDACSEDTLVVVMSDHGAGPHPPYFFNTNSWLRDVGYLTFKTNKGGTSPLRSGVAYLKKVIPYQEKLRRILPETIIHKVRELDLGLSDIDWRKTKAYRFPMYHPAEGIAINLAGRQPEGIVRPGREYETVRDTIIEHLWNLTDPNTGMRIVAEAYRREEIFSGTHLDIVPDIVFVTTEAYKADKYVSDSCIEAVPAAILERYSGLHRMNGIFMIRSPHIRSGQHISGAQITDIAPTVLYALGHDIPQDMDGRVLANVFVDDFVQKHPFKVADNFDRKVDRETVLSDADNEEMRKKLEGLGYL